VTPAAVVSRGADLLNISHWLRERARERPNARAIVAPRGRTPEGRRLYEHVTFAQLDRLIDARAHALSALGVAPGERVTLLVPFGIELIALVYALFRLGAVVTLIDPGMGPRAMVRCLEQLRPAGLIAVPRAHLALSLVGRGLLRAVKHRIRIGKGWFKAGASLERALATAPDAPFPVAPTRPGDVAAVLFTSGSTGPAKGVVYEHGMLDAQVRCLARVYGIEPGEVDLPALPGFALFSVALGCTVVIPDMDFARPSRLDPARFVEAIEDHGVTYSFGSPAVWGPVAAHCAARSLRLPSLRRVLMAGAPVPPRLHETLLASILEQTADTHTPYGATESLPVATIGGRELRTTFAETRAGLGTCVGRPVPGVDVRIIRITDAPIATWSDDLLVPAGEVGEVVVRGDVVTKVYEGLPEATAKAKVASDAGVWHRMGDVGRLDAQGRLWFCGRKGQRLETATGTHFTALEAVFEEHPRVARAALVAVGKKPVLIIEPRPGQRPSGRAEREAFAKELLALAAASPAAAKADIRDVLLHPALPVDVRHNAKIRRELLAEWAKTRVRP
jgi:olefin beta-lactone synthetase